jgi:hypothetical protein
MLGALITTHPSRMTHAELARLVGLPEESAAFVSSVRLLRSVRLVVEDGGFFVVNPRVFVGFE